MSLIACAFGVRRIVYSTRRAVGWKATKAKLYKKQVVVRTTFFPLSPFPSSLEEEGKAVHEDWPKIYGVQKPNAVMQHVRYPTCACAN